MNELFLKNKVKSFLQLTINPYFIPFFIGFFLVANYIVPLPHLIGGMDSESIWQTILTFRNERITSSYVLYKGFQSIYPYLWFYEWAVQLNQDPFIFIKIYHALLFAFISAIAIPYIVATFLGVRVHLYKNVLFVVVLFYMLKFTHVFDLLMVDLQSSAMYVSAICLTLVVLSGSSKYMKILSFICGIFIGLTLCASGQYSLAGYLLIIYIFVSLFSGDEVPAGPINISRIAIFLILIFGISIPKFYDHYFERTIVQPMRERGEWLPTGEEWLINGMTRLLPQYKYGYPDVSNRGIAILKKTEGDNFAERFSKIKGGGGTYSPQEYVNILCANPFDFAVMWATKAFIAVSFDGGSRKVSHLLVSYTSVFICLYILFARLQNFSQVLRKNNLILLSIVSTIAAPVFLFIDMRYSMSLFGFILGVAIHNQQLWAAQRTFVRICFQSKEQKGRKKFLNCPVPYSLVVYFIFIAFCFMLYGALLEIPDSDPSKVLYRW